jgi:HK97 gp10 family phage protein
MAEIITGLSEFQSKLKELERSQQKATLAKAAKAGAKIAIDALQRFAPRDTGLMADGLTVRMSGKESDANEVTVDIKPGKKGWYWFFTNSGTIHLRATHWADRAIESVRDRITEAMKNTMTDEIKKVLK